MKNKNYGIIAGVVLALLILGGGGYFLLHGRIHIKFPAKAPAAPAGEEEAVARGANTVTYMCNENKYIDATFVESTSTSPAVKQGEAPVPEGKVQLAFSNGKAMELPRTISADGTRYANKDESLVFWSKGNGAVVLENDKEGEFAGCVVLSTVPAGLTLKRAYANGAQGFSIRLSSFIPADEDGFAIDEEFKNTLTPSKTIGGVKFTIPASVAKGTNLSSDSYLSVESIPKAKTCEAKLFFDGTVKEAKVTEDNVIYSVASSSDAGAGNRYESIVYAYPETNPCVAVRYLIHSSVLENYPAGTVKAYDRGVLLSMFDQMRKTLVINQ